MTDTDREMQESQRRKRPGKQKKKKKSMKGWLVLIVTVGLILAVVFGCRIKTIRITGNERVSDETIQTLINVRTIHCCCGCLTAKRIYPLSRC